MKYSVGDKLTHNGITYTIEMVDDYNYFLSWPGLVGPPGPWPADTIDNDPAWQHKSYTKWYIAGGAAALLFLFWYTGAFKEKKR